ncbi:MAG: Esterase EstB [Candidatus Heimdallarchaeota archaeon LC_3]|nr:MAG: Esterase EstB [Candidatus Heimdallarchaeota archaeon LC_3]
MEIREVDNQNYDLLTNKMMDYVDNDKLPGLITLVYKNEKIIYNKKFGFADTEGKIPIEFENIFRIASMTKPIVSVAALILFEKGKFVLEDPLSKFIPNAKNLKVYVEKKDDEIIVEDLEREITILDLFTHTSGFIYPMDPNHPVDKQYLDLYGSNFEKRNQMTLKELGEGWFKIPLKHQPGIKYTYSVSTDILGYLIQVISGKVLDKFLKEEIFQKLDMVDTDFYVPEDKKARLVSIHEINKEGKLLKSKEDIQSFPRDKRKFLSGGGGLLSTVSDYLKFAKMFLNRGNLNGVQIITEKTYELMISDHITTRNIIFSVWKREGFPENLKNIIDPDKERNGFGLGVSIQINNEYFPKGIYSWPGAYTTNFWIDPENKIIGIILSQFIPIFSYPIFHEFEKMTYEALKS